MYLIEGNPGTGKTTLALQFLLEGVEHGDACLDVTLSETTVELRAVAQSHGWTLDGIDVFRLASSERATIDEQYTLYHPSEVELGETIVMLRFFEAQGEVRRAISVVKTRTGEHETTTPEFRIGREGLHVGAAVTDFHGVLTGVPHYVGPRGPLMTNERS